MPVETLHRVCLLGSPPERADVGAARAARHGRRRAGDVQDAVIEALYLAGGQIFG
jgi:hypothetical protein